MYPKIALASASPRRRELLQQIGVNFELVAANIDESVLPNELPADYVCRLALGKAQAGASQSHTLLPVLGADTCVVVDNTILGKPTDHADFTQMMQLLSGRKHQVMTAICFVYGTHVLPALSITDVYFRHLSTEEINDYWQSKEPLDKAGGYGIQGLAAKFVERIEGSYSAVVGLPLCETHQLLQQLQRLA